MLPHSLLRIWGNRVTRPIDLSDARCVCCGSSRLALTEVNIPARGISHGAIKCFDCHHAYDVIDGVPFIGGYDRDDFMGLIEVIATADMDTGGTSIETARLLHKLLYEYHHAEDKAAWIESHPIDMVRAPWFADHRYHEWLQAHTILGSRDLQGKKVLNVGAVTGSDSAPLVDAGAIVTCVDYAPSLVANGARNLEQARWMGGFSHVLPFQDESFDVVVSNAALHHFRSVPVALSEMLRVLRPGGLLATTGDPFRPDASDDSLEFSVFGRHEGVLLGINERIIRFCDIWDPIAQHSEHLEIALVVDLADPQRLEGISSLGCDNFNDAWVPCWESNIETLRSSSGGIGCSVIKRSSIPIEATVQGAFTLPAGVLAHWLRDPATAISSVLAWAPDAIVDLPFPGTAQSWFELQNGWLAPAVGSDERTGYRRARWVLRLPAGGRVSFDVKTVEATLPGRSIEVLVDGKVRHRQEVGSEFARCHVTVPPGAGDQPRLIELRLVDLADAPASTFDDACFSVRHRVVQPAGALTA